MRWIPVLLAAALWAAPLAAKADPLAVRETILAQMQALRDGDAAAAYAYAAPSIKRLFPTPERFIQMVRRGYRPVSDAHSPVFLRAELVGQDRFAQEVGITDGDGRSWTVLYTLAKQDDGVWRITGCYLRKAKGQNI